MKQMPILLVDDEAHFVDALAERLTLRGFDVAVALDGASALESLEKRAALAVVLDLRLPDLDGTEVLRRMRERWPELRVLMLTGHGGEDDRRECLALGAEAFINKPVKADDLALMLRNEKEA